MQIFTDKVSRILYSTDASAYKELPSGVCYPQNVADIEELISYAGKEKLSIIPRTAGTSLAGQVVGPGVVADVSKYMNRILEINAQQRWVRLQPGVVLDELNMALAPFGLFFSPETSTSNRCCVGGMTGNNSCGTHSLVYGSVRDHLLEAKVVLSDGSKAVFSKERAAQMLSRKDHSDSLEEKIYAQLFDFSQDELLQKEIQSQFPDSTLRRRNCGYALDLVLKDFDLCTLLAGSEGTLAFIYELTLGLDTLPGRERMLLCAHCDSIAKVFSANLTALHHHPSAVELIDDYIIELSKGNISQNKNRFFIEGDPAAILISEFDGDDRATIDASADLLEKELMASGDVYCCTRVYGPDISKVWDFRKASLGLLSGMKGDSKPVPVIEDTAVSPERFSEYYLDIKKMLDELGLKCVFYGHIGTGELHLRPILNVKEPKDRELFHTVALKTAEIVKRHKGSLSGEHGDGRLRGEFIPLMYGDVLYHKFCELKQLWDPEGIFNPGKIVNTPVMNESLRYDLCQKYPDIKTYFHFESSKGLFCAIEQCNGSADCRHSNKIAGTMCPSYRVGMEEKYSTRARANILRELLTHPSDFKKPFDSPEIYNILEYCLSCKGCKSECPSNVDMTRFKAEFLQHYYDIHGVPLRTMMVANVSSFMRLGSLVPHLYNFFASWSFSSRIIKKIISFAPQRSIPTLGQDAGRKFIRKVNGASPSGDKMVYLFADEFTTAQDTQVGKDFVSLLNKLGYRVVIPRHFESGRAAISKGMVKRARHLAIDNVKALKDIITEDTPLVGIEPSAILSFRDEYPDLVPEEMKKDALSLAANSLLYDEFIVREMKRGHISSDSFSDSEAEIYLHGHCHQKSLIGIEASAQMLSLPKHYRIHIIPSGCCGMAGSFGYEKEHYDFSMAVGELTLFPAVRQAAGHSPSEKTNVIVCAPGTSCRQQIFDGTGVIALHPVQALLKACK